ncbi:type II CAAX endopeptidase family protein [Janthinobacterium sp. SUN033]|uniref:CPBP family intramembrane glutamic endopeptidase n=1 Tax=Janthinobacterium sp. SUN033 TaxID=3002439 RepID=UPI0025AF63D7|nr:type II CAAX endopeptidase family protein [Janthinobacterium sp. SUN033]MDN2680679.1 type II CAAX endopeptidase family protein [Janthinobacterium sp. SUN033]
MMDSTLSMATKKSPLARLMAYPLVQIVLGMVLTFAAVPLVMGLASQLVDKPYRILWPQLLAAVLVWFGYRFYVRRIEKRQPAELAIPGMAGELGRGLLLGAGLVALTFGVLAALGVYQFSGVNALSVLLLLPLAELVLVGMAEEMMFRGILFGVTARALGNKAAIVISSLVFALAHLPNAGFSLLAIIALVAYGVLQAALYMKTRRLWVCIGTHIGWNYCVGQVFSSTVSGHAATDGLLRGELAGNTVLTGGAFGVEGSLVTVLLIGAVAAYLLRLAFASAQDTSRD